MEMSSGVARATLGDGRLKFSIPAIFLLVTALMALFGGPPALAQSRLEVPQFLIVNYHPVSKTRVTGSPDNAPLYDYAYRVDVRNSGARAVHVSGEMTSTRRSVAVIDANATFGTVERHQIKASEDTVVVRAGKFFDRRLDRAVQVNNRWRFEEEGIDPEDDRIFGLLRRSTVWTPSLLDIIYNLKFSLIFKWEIVSRPDADAPTISALAPTGNVSDAQPMISASYVDVGGSIAVAGVVLRVDGVNLTSSAAVSASGISYRPAAPLADGAHSVALTVPDNAGNASNASWSFLVDTQGPIISSVSPVDTASASPTVSIAAQFSDAGSGVDVTSVHLVVDGQDVTALATITSSGLSYKPAAPFVNGTHTVLLRLSDAVGHPAVRDWTFAVDASGPVISSLQPAPGTELAADALPTIAAAFSDAGGIDVSSVQLVVDGSTVTSNAQVTQQSVTYRPAVALDEGNHSVSLRAADVNGNVTEAAWTFVTRSPPQISDMQPDNVLLNASSSVVIFARYRDAGAGIDTSSIRLSVDDVDFTAEAQVTATTITLTPAQPLPQGLHVVALTVADLAGNSGVSSWRFTIDSGLPIVSEQQPYNSLVNNTRPTISTAFADSGAAPTGVAHARTRLYVNGTDVTGAALIDTAAQPHRISYTPTTPLEQGSQTVRLLVYDMAGNEVESVWSFSIDVDGPAITDLLPADGTTLPADTLVTLSVAFVDVGSGVNVSSASVTLDGQDITAQSNVTAAGLNRTYTAPLPEGAHTLVVAVSDRTGNVTSRTSRFHTATAPVVSARAPINSVLPGGATPTITATLSDVGSGVDASSIRLFFNGLDVTQAAQISTTAISYVVTQPLLDSTHSVRIELADLAGLRTESVWQFGTATAPVISATEPKDVMLPVGSRPTISASFSDPRVGIDPAAVMFIVNGIDVTALATITETGISYTPAQPLASGPHTMYLEIANRTNASANAAWGFQVDEPKSYAVNIVSPPGSITVSTPRLEVAASASSNKSLPTAVTVNGQALRSSRTDETT
ncbi:MAG: Ig-like domain-containing protein, partial [Pseudomonadota bacterium]|nr:Ig-like domain-containing protein [Pseudomonadota bacterium]